VRVYVINLERSVDRRLYLSAQLEKLGIDYAIFKAIEPPQAGEWFERYDEARYLKNTGRKASPGEIACFGSHAALWRKAVETGQPLIVLEDDVEILPTFPSALAEANRLIKTYGFLRLVPNGPSRRVRMTEMETAGQFSVMWYTRYPFGSMGYAISPEAAAAFLAHSSVVAGPPDLFIKRFWEHGRPLYGLMPASIGFNDQFGSAPVIGTRAKEKPSATVRLGRLGTKLTGFIARARFNASVRASRRQARPTPETSHGTSAV
jgi:glycosyl transferase family 25